MGFVKAVIREMPDGRICRVFPFHISFEGLERNIICRDDEDCDRMVKVLAVCSIRKNVIIIIYAVVSNHAHVAVLAERYEDAYAYGEEVKRTYSLMFRHKYGEAATLRKTDICVQTLDTDWYLRNALAYIPRNAYDNGAQNIADYKWTGFRAFFRHSKKAEGSPVAKMSRREWRRLFHTGDNLGRVMWLIDSNNELIPASFCDTGYLEKAFANDEAFFYKCVGAVNTAEMTQKLVSSPRILKSDAEFLKEVKELSVRWFNTDIRDLPQSKKTRLLPYVFKTMKTTVPQLARVFGMDRDFIRLLLNVKHPVPSDRSGSGAQKQEYKNSQK